MPRPLFLLFVLAVSFSIPPAVVCDGDGIVDGTSLRFVRVPIQAAVRAHRLRRKMRQLGGPFGVEDEGEVLRTVR